MTAFSVERAVDGSVWDSTTGQLHVAEGIRICYHARMQHEVRTHFPWLRGRTGRRWTLRRSRTPQHIVATSCPDCPATSYFLLHPGVDGYQVQLAPCLISEREQPC